MLEFLAPYILPTTSFTRYALHLSCILFFGLFYLFFIFRVTPEIFRMVSTFDIRNSPRRNLERCPEIFFKALLKVDLGAREDFCWVPTQLFNQITGGNCSSGCRSTYTFTAGIICSESCVFYYYPPIANADVKAWGILDGSERQALLVRTQFLSMNFPDSYRRRT